MAGFDIRRAVVVGGAGFIGRHVCAEFIDHGFSVAAISRNAGAPIPGADLVTLDVTTAPLDEIVKALSPADVVVNAAGDSWHGTDEQMTLSHTALVDRLVEAVSAVPGRPRLVHLGSVHEYGPVADGTAISEDDPPAPVTLYARTKLASTGTVLDATRSGRIDGCVLRLSNVHGPGAPRGSFLGRLAGQLRATGEDDPLTLTILPDRRDVVDVRDVARAVVLAARAPVTGRIVNVGQGEATSVREVVETLVRISGVPPHLVREHDAPVQSKGAGWTKVDIGRARQLLDWSPRVSLEESLRDLWDATPQQSRPAATAAPVEGH